MQVLAPLAALMQLAPCVQWSAGYGVKPSGHADRTFAFLDEPTQDALILAAGLKASSLRLDQLNDINRAQLKRDLALFHAVYAKHQPTKFKQLSEVMRKLSDQDREHRVNRPVNQFTSTGVYITDRNESYVTMLNEWTNVRGQLDTYLETSSTQNYWVSDMAHNNARVANVTLLSDGWRRQRIAESNAITTINRTFTTSMYYSRFQDVEDWSNDTNSTIIIHATDGTATATTGTAVIRPRGWTSTQAPAPKRSSLFRELECVAKKYQDGVPEVAKRRVIKRQIDLLDSVLDKPGDVNVFLKGEALEIESKTSGLRYRFTRREASRSVHQLVEASHSSTPYQLEVFSQDNVYLSSLCVYVKKTPALDQLAAMILYIQSGEEAQLLTTGNFYRVGDSERLNQELQRLGLLKKAPSYQTTPRGQEIMVAPSMKTKALPNPEQALIAQRYPEMVALRTAVKDYYFLRLFSKPTLH